VEPPPSARAHHELPPVWAVVPHRERAGEDSGRGYVVRQAAVAPDGSLTLPSPYVGAPIVRTFAIASRAAAEHLANQMSGLAPKTRIARLVAAKRIVEALESRGYVVELNPKHARPGQAYFISARKGIDTGTLSILDGVFFWADFDQRYSATRAAANEAREAVAYALAGDEPHTSADPRAKRISRLAAAESIAKALRKVGWDAEIRWDIEHPDETINIRASRGNSVGFVLVRFDGQVDTEGVFSRDRTIDDLMDDALKGAQPDPALNPPPQRRTAITDSEAAYEVASLLSNERQGLEDRGADWYTDTDVSADVGFPASVLDVFRNEPHPTLGGDYRVRRHLGRVRVFDDGRVEYSDFAPDHEAHMRDAVTRALAGRTILPRPKRS
jgi:hypothetical protein